MSEIRVWVETAHHAAFRCGGWAYVRRDGPHIEGAAGGGRDTTAERSALGGLAAALQGLPAGKPVSVASASPLIVGVPRRIAGFAKEPPAENLDLWAQIATALKDRPVSFAAATPEPKSPTAFAAAWAELARDKAKMTGAFSAPIPRTNLAKAGA
ncbi:MAG TPA: hypothetical protein VHN73_03960 [Phenylobacterium sp.]|nr:hypothetical protein [Phenylobacterium sp.]